jgi:hypothetical protein
MRCFFASEHSLKINERQKIPEKKRMRKKRKKKKNSRLNFV